MSIPVIKKKFISVPAPFDADSPGDCYLQSGDGHKFKVYKLVLSLASPVFRNMFTLPQPSDTTHSEADLPIVPMSEDAHTIHRLLILFYPPGETEPPPVSVDLFVNLIEAHEKYDIPRGALTRITRDMWQSEKDLLSGGIKMYAAAWRLKLANEARIASRYTHNVDLEDPDVAQDIVQRSGSFNSVLSLIKLRRAREEALDGIISTLSLRTSLCAAHGGSRKQNSTSQEEYYWIQVAALKEKLREAVAVPHPKCMEAFEFLGISTWALVEVGPKMFGGFESSCVGRSCWEKPPADVTAKLAAAIDKYPQELEPFSFVTVN